VRLEVDSDDAVLGREQLEVGAEHLESAEPAVKKDEGRAALAEFLVAEVDAVDAR
jgi:hypothetical protein